MLIVLLSCLGRSVVIHGEGELSSCVLQSYVFRLGVQPFLALKFSYQRRALGSGVIRFHNPLVGTCHKLLRGFITI